MIDSEKETCFNHYLCKKRGSETDMNFVDVYKNKLAEQFERLDKQCRRKLMLMSVERQFKMYCELAEGKEWKRDNEYRDLLDKFWRITLEKEQIEESIWEWHETIRPDNVNKSGKEYTCLNFAYANIFAGNIETLIETFLEDTDHEESFLLFNIDLILSYLNEDHISQAWKYDEYESHKLIGTGMENQKNDMQNVNPELFMIIHSDAVNTA